MQTQRRRFLQCSLSVPLCLPSVLSAKSISGVLNKSDFNLVEIKDDLASPLINNGDYVLVDTQVSSFQGEGVYLYPDWGQPRVYEIKKEKGGELGFYSLGRQQRLWTVTVNEGQTLFSGQAVKVLNASSHQQNLKFLQEYGPLQVPDYPIN